MKSKKIIVALVCGLCLLTACNSTSTTKKDKSNRKDSKEKVEAAIDEEIETEQTTKEESEIEESALDEEETIDEETIEEEIETEQTTSDESEIEETTQEYEEEIIDIEPSEEAVSRVCIGQSISFEVPEDSWYEDIIDNAEHEYYRIYMYADPDYQETIIEGNEWMDSMESFTTKEEHDAQIEEILASPVDYLDIDCNAKQVLCWFYDEDITNAKMASECCYKAFVDSGYDSAPAPTKNAAGKYTIDDIDGSICYVVWHSGSSDNPLLNAIQYDCFVDLPSGNIMEIVYCDYSSTVMNNVWFVLDSIKFI